MIKAFAVATCLALSAGSVNSRPVVAPDPDVIAQAQFEMQAILGLVEKALTEPMPDLKAKADAGKVHDKLIYGLALKAGRMGSAGKRDAKKWIKSSQMSYDTEYVTSPLPVEERPQTPKAVGKTLNSSIPTTIYGRNPRSDYSTHLVVLSKVWIDTASSCVDSLIIGPNRVKDLSFCGGEESYLRLYALMPDSEK